jgi:hypothetical protein
MSWIKETTAEADAVPSTVRVETDLTILSEVLRCDLSSIE